MQWKLTSGSEGGPGKPTRGKSGRAPRSDPYTYCSTWSGIVYVAFVIDVCSRRLVGWKAARSMTAALVVDALNMAAWTRRHTSLDGLVCHTDAGSQGGFNRWSQHLEDGGVERWVRVGNKRQHGQCGASCVRQGDRRVGNETNDRNSGSGSRRGPRARTQRSRSGLHPRSGPGGSVRLEACDRSVSSRCPAVTCH